MKYFKWEKVVISSVIILRGFKGLFVEFGDDLGFEFGVLVELDEGLDVFLFGLFGVLLFFESELGVLGLFAFAFLYLFVVLG